MDQMAELYEAIHEAGASLGLLDYGSYAMNAMRIEKAYKAMGSELTTEITPVEADIQRFVDWEKDFIGRDEAAARRDADLETMCVYGELDANGADARGNEPIWSGGQLIGLTTAGAFGHTVQKSLFFAYVDPDHAAPGSEFEIQILDQRRRARVLPEAAWDPENERVRA
jgi:dimethylglycine dehydrogenase